MRIVTGYDQGRVMLCRSHGSSLRVALATLHVRPTHQELTAGYAVQMVSGYYRLLELALSTVALF